MNIYQVVVGNVGSVYVGPSEHAARQKFNIYRKDSIDGYGRVAGEDVTLIYNDAIIAEHHGTANDEEEL